MPKGHNNGSDMAAPAPPAPAQAPARAAPTAARTAAAAGAAVAGTTAAGGEEEEAGKASAPKPTGTPTTTTQKKKADAALRRKKANEDVRRLIERSDHRDQILNPTVPPRPRPKEIIRRRLDYDKIILTPLNLRPGRESPCMFLSRYDYLQEMEFFTRDAGGALWDEDRFGHASPGFLLAFVQYQPARGVDIMEIFEVVGKAGVSHRRRHWNIPGQGKRRVLRLSQMVGSVRYSAYARAMGYGALGAGSGGGGGSGRFGAVKGTVVRRWPKDITVDIAVF